ncbi:hypothetical protein GCM10020254_22630 [Streptomyces goshikiensis]
MVAAARYTGADEVVAKLPHGYETLLARVFRGASELSGGQWQKFGLARTRYRDARVIVVDEPTSALDPAAEIAAFDSIRGLAGPHRAVVLVTHRMSGGCGTRMSSTSCTRAGSSNRAPTRSCWRGTGGTRRCSGCRRSSTPSGTGHSLGGGHPYPPAGPAATERQHRHLMR